MLGIKYLKTNEWSTNRKETRILQIFGLIGYIVGAKGPTTNEQALENVKILRKRQINRSRDIDLTSYFDKDLNLSFFEFERFLIKSWTNEISESMGIKKPNEDEFIEAIMVVRTLIQMGSKFAMFIHFIKHWKVLMKVKPYFESLALEEKTIMLAPFLTTIDTTILNFLEKKKPTRMREAFDKVPVVFVAMQMNGEIVIADVVANEADNPGNSVFGPKGVICPGNIITSMLIKSMMELINNLDYETVGEPKIEYAGFICSVENKKDIRIVSKAFNKEKVKLDWVVDDIENE